MPDPADRFRPLLERWGALWGVPDLATRVTVEPSTRLRRSLGRCRPATGRITIRASLLDGDPGLLEEVLCHEAAHVAARVLAGPEARPHGAEWRELVRAAGFEPRIRRGEDVGDVGDVAPAGSGRTSGRFRYEHRCPVCQSVRYANTPLPRWRCLECAEAGLAGAMEVRRVRH